jgi:sporulation protein YlmC with PRC-barrel domain
MLQLENLRRYTIGATDGEVGQVETVYFDDESWTVRYLVVDTGNWLSGRKVLISPRCIHGVDRERERVVTNLTREQVETSPDIDTHKPVSRQDEIRYYNHYDYPDYWTGPYRWGFAADPFLLGSYPPAYGGNELPPTVARELAARPTVEEEPHLRSAAEVTGYGIQATDGSLGHVEEFLIDETTWTIRYLIVDPQNWWPGSHVVISPEWIREVNHSDTKVHVDLTREAVRNAPVYDPSRPVERDWERRLHGHFDRRGYWDRPPDAWRLRPPASRP